MPGCTLGGRGNTSAMGEPSRADGRPFERSMRVPSGSTSTTGAMTWPSTTSKAAGGSDRGTICTQLPCVR